MSQWTILHFFHHYPPVVSGYAKRSYEIVKQTAPFAQSVIVTPPLDKEKAPTQMKGDMQEKGEIYRLRKSPLPPLRHIGHRLAERLMLELLLRKVLRKHPIHLVHAHMPYLYALPALRLGKKRGLKTIYEVRGIWEESAVAEGKIEANSTKYFRRRRGEDKAIALADRIVVLSQALAEELKHRGVAKEKIKLIPNAVDCSSFQPQSKSKEIEERYNLKGKVVLGYIGTLRKMEGLQNVISLFPRLLEKKVPLHFLIVGFGEYQIKLEEQVKQLDLESSVTFTGAVAPDKILPYYSVMDMVVFPRLKLRVTELVTPLKPLEAMAMGKPVLASRVGGLTEYCLDQVNSLTFSPEPGEEFIQLIEELAKDVQKRETLGQQALKWVQTNRDWSQVAQGYKEIYQELIEH